MPKKYHKAHRHRHKYSSKSRTNHTKHRKEHNPDLKTSTEKVRVDKNACGDHSPSEKVSSKDKSKQCAEGKCENDNKGLNIVQKDYLKIVEDSLNPRPPARHHSLEKNEDSFLKKTKLLFRKEKSFNDAGRNEIVADTINIENNNDDERENRHKHRSKRRKEKGDIEKAVKKNDNGRNGKLEGELVIGEEKSHKRKHKSKDKSPRIESYGRVQEVIFCQLDQVPLKMKNDKDGSEVKDLYRRLKKEKNHDVHKEERTHHRSHSHRNGSKKLRPEKDNDENKPNRDRRSKSPKKSESLSKNENLPKSRGHTPEKHENKATPRKKQKTHMELSELSMSPFEKYFIFDRNCRSEHCKKQSKKREATKSADRHNPNRHPRKLSDEAKPTINNRENVEEDKIHRIVENDLKTYFCKFQNIIDKKLDVLLQINKVRKDKQHELKNKNRSKSKGENVDVDKKRMGKNDGEIDREELVKEIMKRLKEEQNNATTVLNENNDSQNIEKEEGKGRHETGNDLIKHTKNKHESNSKGDLGTPSVKALKCIHSHKNKERNDLKEPQHAHSTGEYVEKNITKLQLKDSLKCAKCRRIPADKLIVDPFEDIKTTTITQFEITSRPCTSLSSCKNTNNLHNCEHSNNKYSASEETIRDKYHEDRRRSSSPGRYAECFSVMNHRKSKKGHKTLHTCGAILSRSSSKQNVFIQDASPDLKEILSPPESFRYVNTEPQELYHYHPFTVRGIEPPISECSRHRSRCTKPPKKLECKTMSIVGILPENNMKSSAIMKQTEKSNKLLQLPVTNRDLVERRKQSKRFKLYYNYSVGVNANDELLKVPSIISDSYKLVSDPSEEVLTTKKSKNEHKHPDFNAIMHQNVMSKKWNVISTPRESHLNNIIEESSDTSPSLQNKKYFVPLHGTKEYYCRGVTSSHSDYCFRIDKKPANSNISLKSKDTLDGNRNNRRSKLGDRSKSDFKFLFKSKEYHALQSKSDVFIDENRGKKIIRSVFLEDSHTFVRTKNTYNKKIQKSVLNKSGSSVKSCKASQTVDATIEEIVNQNNCDQFKEIYKTIDALEENIHSTRQMPPATADAAVSVVEVNVEQMSSTKPQFDEIYRTIDNLESRVIPSHREEPAIKAEANMALPRCEKIHRSTSCKQYQSSAVGKSVTKFIHKGQMTNNRSREAKREAQKQFRSTAVSPIRFTEETYTQVVQSPIRKPTTPRSSLNKPFLTGKSLQKKPKINREISPPAGQDMKKDQSVDDKRKDTFSKSPLRSTLHSKERQSRKIQRPVAAQRQLQCVKVFKSEDKGPKVEKYSAQDKNNSKVHLNQQTLKLEKETFTDSIPMKVAASTVARQQKCLKTSNMPYDTCVHYHDEHKQYMATSTKSKPVIVNTASYKYQSTKNKAESSTSSSVSDALPQVMRRSKSLMEFGSRKDVLARSNSEIFCPQRRYRHPGTKDGSIVSNNMEKFANIPRMRCGGSKSHSASLDQYMGKKYATSLFLTKNYKSSTISAYQKRKLYDQTMRQKMKKKLELGPQIFEVRFLSMMNKDYVSSTVNSENIILHEQHTNSQDDALNDRIAKNSEELKVKERNLIFDNFEEINVKKDNYVDVDTKNGRGIDYGGCLNRNEESIVEVCGVGGNFNEKVLEYTNSNCNPQHINYSFDYGDIETLYPTLNKFSQTNLKPEIMPVSFITNATLKKPYSVENIFTSSYKSTDSKEESKSSSGAVKDIDSTLLQQPISCPLLTTNTSSFEFLYEDNSVSDNQFKSREAVLASLTQPLEHSFNFSTASHYNVETPSVRALCDEISESIESGYASVKSKSGLTSSLNNFFKKTNIVPLFKSPSLTKHDSKQSTPCKEDLFDEMTKNCHLYAQKIRQSREIKFKDQEDYEEFPLKLLLSERGSDVLRNSAMTLRSTESDSRRCTEMTVEPQVEMINIFQPTEQERKELSGSDDIQENVSSLPEASFSQTGCKLILSNKSLKITSITYLGPEILEEEIKNNTSIQKSWNKSAGNVGGNKLNGSSQESLVNLDVSLDSCNPFAPPNDSRTQTFFTSLIKVYEKEMEICNALYSDAEFSERILIAAANNRIKEGKRRKRGLLKKFLGKKQPDRTGNDAVGDKQSEVPIVSSRLRILASKTRKYFTMLAEAAKVNENIDNELKICGLLRLLERIQDGDFQLKLNDEPINLDSEIRNQVLDAFVNVYELCARSCRKRLTDNQVQLIKMFVIKYRMGLLSKTDLIASCIGHGYIQTENQLKDAVTFLIRSQTQNLTIDEFREYCKFTK